MFFDSYRAFRILDIFKVKRESKKGYSEGRSWAAISFRTSGSSQFESDDGIFTADAGSVIYIPAGVSFSRKGSTEELYIIHLTCFECENDSIEVINHKNSLAAENEFAKLHEEWLSKKPGYRHKCSAILYNILSKLKTEDTGALPPYKSNMIIRGVEMINSHFDNPELSVRMLAEACNISPEYFRLLYKAEYGISPHKAISEKRIEKAKRLLQAGYFSIARVADECGFQNTKHFSALFREKCGMSPREYRNLYK